MRINSGGRSMNNTSAERDVSPAGTPSRRELFEVLSNTRRRYAIRYLLQRDEAVDLRTLSEQVAAWETGKPVDEVTPEERHRVYNALQQLHLPKMAAASAIEIDRNLVYPTDAIQDYRMYIEIVPQHEIPWSLYYVALGVLGLVLAGIVSLGVVPLAVQPSGYLALLAVVLLCSGLVNFYQQRKLRLDLNRDPPVE
jgi:hypothetical protein